MNWDMKTATGREKLIIRDRKLCALYKMEPDLMADKPYSFFPLMADDCVFRSERMRETLTGQAIRNFLIREKHAACDTFDPSPETDMVESEEDGDILMRIRRRSRDRTVLPDGELIRLELNEEGNVRLIERCEEHRLPYRVFRTSVSLTPLREIREGDTFRYEQDRTQVISFSDLYYDVITLAFDIVPSCPNFEEMEERTMELSDWAAVVDLWKEINRIPDYETLHDMIFRAEEKIFRDYRWYEEEVDDLVRSVLENREPYGRRMQAWLEDWVNHCSREYRYVRKC